MSSVLGLDIGSHTMKLVELEKRGGDSYELLTASVSPSPQKVVNASSQEELQAAADRIRTFVRQSRTKAKTVYVALPESQVFTRVIELPQLSRQELSSSMRWEAEQYIPLPLDQVNMDFAILREAKDSLNGMMQVLLVAAPKTLIEKYVDILERADLDVLGVETEIVSASRGIFFMAKNAKTCMLVSVGAQTTDLAILQDGVIALTRSISVGGESLSRALVQMLGFKENQAEELKKTYGLDNRLLEGKIVQAVIPVMDTIIGEIKRAFLFYQEKYKVDRFDLLILSGGTAKLPGIVSYMKERLGVDVQVANPWMNIRRDQKFAFLDQEGSIFTVAVGLAKR